MKQLILAPNSWACSYAECPPGFFVNSGRQLCFKSEYSENGRPVGYNSEGEFYCGDLDEMVQPVEPKWEEVEY